MELITAIVTEAFTGEVSRGLGNAWGPGRLVCIYLTFAPVLLVIFAGAQSVVSRRTR